MPRLIVTNNSQQTVRRANKTFPPKETKETFIRESKINQIDACKYLDWEYTEEDKVRMVLKTADLDNLEEEYTARELKEMARKVGTIEGYAKMVKAKLAEHLLEAAIDIGLYKQDSEEGDEDESTDSKQQ